MNQITQDGLNTQAARVVASSPRCPAPSCRRTLSAGNCSSCSPAIQAMHETKPDNMGSVFCECGQSVAGEIAKAKKCNCGRWNVIARKGTELDYLGMYAEMAKDETQALLWVHTA